jgi:nucleoside-diphosphate-sugar epimerase
MSKPVLFITGYSGYIGAHLLPLLLSEYTVVGVGRQRLQHLHDFIYCDLRVSSFDFFKQYRADFLVHLAWDLSGNYWDTEENSLWRSLSYRLVEAFLKAGGQKVLATGTCAEYLWDNSSLEESTSALSLNTRYAVEKNKTAFAMATLCKQYDAEGVWARLFYSFGSNEPQGKLIRSTLECLSTQQLAYCHRGNQILDYLYVKDVASALKHSLLYLSGLVNICRGEGIFLPDLLQCLARELSAEQQLRINVDTPSEPLIVVGSNQRLSQSGWRPRYNLKQALQEMIKGSVP